MDFIPVGELLVNGKCDPEPIIGDARPRNMDWKDACGNRDLSDIDGWNIRRGTPEHDIGNPGEHQLKVRVQVAILCIGFPDGGIVVQT